MECHIDNFGGLSFFAVGSFEKACFDYLTRKELELIYTKESNGQTTGIVLRPKDKEKQ